MKVVWIAPSFDENDTYTFGTCGVLLKEAQKYAEIIPIDVSRFGNGKWQRFKGLQMAFKDAAKQKPDAIFSHMLQQGSLALIPQNLFYRIPHFVWYAREHRSPRLDMLSIFATFVTSSKEGCPYTPRFVLHQFVDTAMFTPAEIKKDYLLYTGRISPIKRLEVLAQAYSILKRSGMSLPKVKMMGRITDDAYFSSLNLTEEFEHINGMPFSDMPKLYQGARLFISPSETGSFDRTTLEAMSCGIPVLVCGKSFVNDKDFPEMCKFKEGDANDLANKMKWWLDNFQNHHSMAMRSYVMEKHNIKKFTEKLFWIFRNYKK